MEIRNKPANEKVNHVVKASLAKLLASENIVIRHGNFSTAFFNPQTRVLGLPNWDLDDKNLYDLLIGHEVGHALYTPNHSRAHLESLVPGCPFTLFNLVEDVRIERKMQEKFPGLISCFRKGYTKFIENDFFKIANKNVVRLAKMGFADRLNLHAKIGKMVNIHLTPEEMNIYRECYANETFEDVVITVRRIYKMIKARQEAREKAAAERATKKEELEAEEKKPKPTAKLSSPCEDGDEEDDPTGNGNDGDMSEGNEDEDEASSKVLKPTDEECDEESNNSSTESEGDPDEGETPPTGSSSSLDDNDEDEDGDDFTGDPEELGDGDHGCSGDEGGVGGELTIEEELKSETMANAETSLLDIQEKYNYKTPVQFTAPTAKECMEVVVPFEKVMESRNRLGHRRTSDEIEDVRKFKKACASTVAVLAKAFERKKAAKRYSRATTATRGTLDVNRIHAYRYDDKIFKSITTLADEKSHGLVFFIDYSGSMQSTISAVINQTLQLCMFAKAVNIPFEVYGFTNTCSQSTYRESRPMAQSPNDIMMLNSTQVFELLSSRMNNKVFDRAFADLRTWSNTSLWDRSYVSSIYEYLSGTPLYETVLIAHEIVKQFKLRTRVQKPVVIFLTDGDGSTIRFGALNTVSEFANSGNALSLQPQQAANVTTTLHGRKFAFPKTPIDTYRAFIENLRITQDCVAIGFYVLSDTSYNNVELKIKNSKTFVEKQNFPVSQMNALLTAFTGEGSCMTPGGHGFDQFILLSNRVANAKFEIATFGEIEGTAHEDEDTTSKAAVNRLAKSFIRHKKVGRKGRIILEKFIDTIA
jgi:Mg-chelatase subunit ChlD